MTVLRMHSEWANFFAEVWTSCLKDKIDEEFRQ